MTAAELLRSVTRALASGSEDEAFALLPGRFEPAAVGRLGWEAGTLTIPAAGVGVLRVPLAVEPDETLLAAAESVGTQLALYGAQRDSAARRRAVLDVAFDSVLTMDDRGVVLSANRAAERLFGYAATDMVGREVAELIIPPSLREAHRDGLSRYLKTGRGPVVGRRVELTAMRADGSEFPVELVVTRPEMAPGHPGGLLRLRARSHRALRGRDRAAPARRRAGGAAARGDGGRGRERVRAAVRVGERGGRAAAGGADGAHVPLRHRRAGRDDRRRLGGQQRARAAGRHAHAARRRHGHDARVAHRAARADGLLRAGRGRARGDGCAATACRPWWPRRSSSAARCGAP